MSVVHSGHERQAGWCGEGVLRCLRTSLHLGVRSFRFPGERRSKAQRDACARRAPLQLLRARLLRPEDVQTGPQTDPWVPAVPPAYRAVCIPDSKRRIAGSADTPMSGVASADLALLNDAALAADR